MKNTLQLPGNMIISSPAEHLTKLMEDVISAILFKHDPCKINFEENYGEYLTEAKCILKRMSDCRDDNELKSIIDKVFTHSFNSNWGHFISPIQKSVHLGLMARQIWIVKQILVS